MREEQTKTTTERLIFHVDVNQRLFILGVGAADQRGTAGSAGHSCLYRRRSDEADRNRCGKVDPGEKMRCPDR